MFQISLSLYATVILGIQGSIVLALIHKVLISYQSTSDRALNTILYPIIIATRSRFQIPIDGFLTIDLKDTFHCVETSGTVFCHECTAVSNVSKTRVFTNSKHSSKYQEVNLDSLQTDQMHSR